MAIITVKNRAITLDAAEIPNLDASKITTGNFDASRIGSGTFADARIAASNVSQHATSFDDNKLVNDISTLALRQASNENKAAYNTQSMYIDVFQDSTGYTNVANTLRNSNEYISTISETSSATDISWNYRTSLAGLHYQRGGSGGPDFHQDGNDSSENIYNWLSGYDGQSASGFSEQNSAHYHTLLYDLGAGKSYIPTHYDYYFQDGTSQLTSIQIVGFNTRPSSAGFASDNVQLATRGSVSNGTSVTESISTSTKFRYLAWVKYYSGGNNWGNNHSHRIRGTLYSTTVNATGNFTCPNITASSSVSSMGAIITYQNESGTNALNTDIVLQLSADGGSNYSTATLVAMPDFATGIKMAKVNDLSVTAGTSLKYKISFANQASGSKEARIRGVSLQY